MIIILIDRLIAPCRAPVNRLRSGRELLRRHRHHRLRTSLHFIAQRARLWGKAQALLSQAAKGLQEPELRRGTWLALAELAEQREDAVAAAQAWKQAARVGV